MSSAKEYTFLACFGFFVLTAAALAAVDDDEEAAAVMVGMFDTTGAGCGLGAATPMGPVEGRGGPKLL